jgi:O-antigen/teichoic acid export membrane protein
MSQETLIAPVCPPGVEGFAIASDPLNATRPKSTRSQTVQYGAGYVMFAVGRVLRDLAVARILGPSRFGMWGALLVYRQYSNYTDFGFTNGLGRVLPRLLEEGKEPEARRAMGTAWLVAMAGTLLFALAVALKFLASFGSYSTVWLWGILTITVLMFIDKHYMYSSVVFRSRDRVGESGLWMGLLGGLELALGIWLTRRYGLYGLYVSVSLAQLSAVICMYVRQPSRGVFRPSLPSFRTLLIPSLTLMGLGLGNIAIHNADRVVLLWARGPGAELGEYQVAASISLVVSQLPYILLTVLVPKLFRFSSESTAKLRPYFLLPTTMIAIAGAAVGSLGYVVLPTLLGWLLPRYVLVASLAGILMLGEVCFAIAMVPETLLVAQDRGFQSLLLRCFTVGGATSASWWALSHGHGLPAVAGCMCAAQAVGALIVGLIAAHSIRISPLRYLVAAFAPVSYALAALVAVLAVVPASLGRLESLLMKLMLSGLALSPLAALPLWFAGIRLPGVSRIVAYLHWTEAG